MIGRVEVEDRRRAVGPAGIVLAEQRPPAVEHPRVPRPTCGNRGSRRMQSSYRVRIHGPNGLSYTGAWVRSCAYCS